MLLFAMFYLVFDIKIVVFPLVILTYFTYLFVWLFFFLKKGQTVCFISKNKMYVTTKLGKCDSTDLNK